MNPHLSDDLLEEIQESLPDSLTLEIIIERIYSNKVDIKSRAVDQSGNVILEYPSKTLYTDDRLLFKGLNTDISIK